MRNINGTTTTCLGGGDAPDIIKISIAYTYKYLCALSLYYIERDCSLENYNKINYLITYKVFNVQKHL